MIIQLYLIGKGGWQLNSKKKREKNAMHEWQKLK